jgi:hypothetical protein
MEAEYDCKLLVTARRFVVVNQSAKQCSFSCQTRMDTYCRFVLAPYTGHEPLQQWESVLHNVHERRHLRI